MSTAPIGAVLFCIFSCVFLFPGPLPPAQCARIRTFPILDVAAHCAEGEQPGSAYDELAAFLRAVAALLQGRPAPSVPPAYAERFAAIQA